MRPYLSTLLIFGSVLLPFHPASAQMHKVAKPEQVVRAVGVYEWTGDLKKPNASRLVPVSLFIDGSLQDAGVYLPRPIPFALTPGNEYQLEQAGIVHGELDLTYARHLQTADAAYEDGWSGYGSYKAPPAPKKETALRPSRSPAVLTSSKDDSRPHFGGRSDTSGSSDPAPAGKDPQATSDISRSTGSTPADDPDRPTMRRRNDSSPATDTNSTTATGASPENDPDRPTLRRRSPEDAKKAKNDTARVTGTGSLNDDPDRPKLQRGGRNQGNDTEIAQLVGVPKDLHQMVAVSDAANRPPHDFARPWEDDKERAAILARMQTLARAQLAGYSTTNPETPAPIPGKPAAVGAATRRTPAQRRAAARAAAKPAVAEVALLDEDLRGYLLSYGGAPTYVYTAHTAGTGSDLRWVTVVAQADLNGELQPAIKSVTDEAHLDRTPHLRFVDVVDAEASNRASLLFEVRAQSVRQFALYRVIGARAETIFTTGTTQ